MTAENRKMEVITNHHWREPLSGWELSESERKELDYIPDIDEQCGRFFRYHRQIYDLREFMRIPDQPWAGTDIRGWHGYMSDTYFSGILVKYDDDCERVMVGRYFS